MSMTALLITLVLAQPAAADLERSVLGFADNLFEAQEYYRAIGEYERYLHACQEITDGCEQVSHARLRIAEAYRRGGARERAIELFAAIEAGDSAQAAEAGWRHAQTLTELEDYTAAAASYGRFASRFPADSRADEARWLTIWSHIRARELEPARTAAKAVSEDSAHHAASVSLLEDLDRVDDLPRRSPVVSGLLSAALPGAGQAYVGRWRDALSSLLMNALWTSAALIALNQQEYAVAVIVGAGELFWYGGNIFGAITAAHRFNDVTRKELFKSLETKYLPADSRAALSIPLLTIEF